MVAALIAASACDMSGIPRVAGTYRGTMTVQAGTLLIRAPMRMTVEQSGSQVTVSGSVTYEGYTWGFPPAMSGTVDATGAFTAEELAGGMVASFSPTTSSSPCGTIGGGYATLTFSGNEADFNLAAQTSRCGLVTYHATLTR